MGQIVTVIKARIYKILSIKPVPDETVFVLRIYRPESNSLFAIIVFQDRFGRPLNMSSRRLPFCIADRERILLSGYKASLMILLGNFNILGILPKNSKEKHFTDSNWTQQMIRICVICQ